MVGWLKFNIIEKIPFIVYLEIQCITFKTEKSFIAHPWIQGSVVGLEEYTAHDWRAATSGTTRSSYLVWVGPVEITSESHVHMVHFVKRSPGEKKTRPSIAQNITTTRNQTAAMNCHTYIAPFTMEWRLVSCLWRLWLPPPFGLLCQFECRWHQDHRCIFPNFRPPVTLSTLSWFCCRSRCRPVSSWCRVSLLPLELRCPSTRTQSP